MIALKRKVEVDFSWTDDELQLFLEALLDFKSASFKEVVGNRKDLNMKIFWMSL